MNILIVGNGFDLSHYLPTKYDHFMMAMDAIENWDESTGDMGFDDLFGSLYEKEDYFFGYTKAMYKTDKISVSVEKIKELKAQLNENIWYQYFSDHVREVKTWIDFEIKIHAALVTVDKFFKKYQFIKESTGSVYNQVSGLFSSSGNTENLNFLERERLILKMLDILEVQNMHEKITYIDYQIKKCFLDDYKDDITLNYQKIIAFLMRNLNNLKEIFSKFLIFTVDSFEIKFSPKNILPLDLIYTFNYTSTLENKYKQSKSIVHHIHGENEKNNIVLGVSDLDESFLTEFKPYGFTKYHQKLMNDTDYQFLRESRILNRVLILNRTGSPIRKSNQKEIINIVIWGHSLNISDESYIQEIFSFNNEVDENIRIKVFYFNEQAKFDLLANLLEILKKGKVEHWMKKGWLKFELNPDIAKINDIKPVDLPKIIAKVS